MIVKRFKGNPVFFTAKTVTEGTVSIQTVEVVNLNDEERLVLAFEGEHRQLRLTPHQVSALARAFGEDTEQWIGGNVLLKKGADKGIEMTIIPREPNKA